jgi:hypothetical protein
VANVGQAVNRRVALQVVADVGAYTGATVMATGMNHLAYWNRQIQRTYGYLSAASFQFNTGVCYLVYPAILTYETTVGTFEFVRFSYASAIGDRAREVSDANARDLFPGETLDYAESDPGEGILPGHPPFITMFAPVSNGASPDTSGHDWANEDPLDYAPNPRYIPPVFVPPIYGTVGDLSIGYKQWQCWYYIPPFTVGFLPAAALVSPWWKLTDTGVPGASPPYHFVWRVTAPSVPARIRLFGPIPEMKAVAVARAVGGNIEEGDSRYRAKMTPVSKVMLLPVARDPRYDRGVRPVLH